MNVLRTIAGGCFRLAGIAGCCTILTVSCTKKVDKWSDVKAATIYDTTSSLAANRIITYKVLNTGSDAIFSSVNNKEKTITVYLPYYYALYYMETEIILPAGSTIIPAATALAPVFSDTTFTYTITDANGAKATYALHTVIQQPDLQLNELSTATSTTTLFMKAGGSYPFTGKNFVPSNSVTKLNLVDASGKVIYQFDESSIEPYTYQMNFTGSANALIVLAKDTDYWLQVKSYNLTYTTKYPIRINY